MKYFFLEYSMIFFFLFVSILLSLLIFFLSFFVANQVGGTEKLSAYECGFEPFEDARNTFDVRFYVIALLFMIFDLEVTFIFPWAVTLASQTFMGFWSMMLFLILLTVGFIYELKKGALD